MCYNNNMGSVFNIVGSPARPSGVKILYFMVIIIISIRSQNGFFLFHNNNNNMRLGITTTILSFRSRLRTSRTRCSDFNAIAADEQNVLQLAPVGTIYYYSRRREFRLARCIIGTHHRHITCIRTEAHGDKLLLYISSLRPRPVIIKLII